MYLYLLCFVLFVLSFCIVSFIYNNNNNNYYYYYYYYYYLFYLYYCKDYCGAWGGVVFKALRY